nr:MAG TPA: hypothetical protein [Caudoviricetes sp.]
MPNCSIKHDFLAVANAPIVRALSSIGHTTNFLP